MPGGRPTKYKPEMCDDVVKMGSDGMGLVEISTKLGISFETFTVWRREKKEFSDAIKESIRQCQAWWEAKGREATFGGVEGFNATSYIFQMKNRFRDDWRDKHEHDVKVEGSIEIIIGGEDE